jgi:glycosyltransferase involved in cell wall biosynthesis
MNILLLHTYIKQNCGISTYIKTIAHGLTTRKHTVYIAALDTPEARTFINGDIDFIAVLLDQYRKNPYTFLLAFFQLVRIIRRHQIQVILSSHRWCGFVAYFAARFTGCQLVSVDQNILWGNKQLTIWGDRVISVSNFGKRHLVDYFNVSDDSISVVYNATRDICLATDAAQQAVREEFGLIGTEDNPVLITVGRLEEQKGQEYLIQAMPTIMRTFPNVRLLIVGEGTLDSQLKALVQAMDLEANVLFTGLRDDVSALLSVANLFVLPSLWEGLPFAMLEAMWLGLPVVVTSVGGIPEVINLASPPLGLLVPPKDNAALAEAVISGLMEKQALKEMAARGRDVVQAYFNADLMAERTEQVLQDVVVQG